MTVSATLVVSIILISVILWIRWRRKKLKTFEELGIPGPPPHFLFGNILEINKKGLFECQDEWIKKYGQFVGVCYLAAPLTVRFGATYCATGPDLFSYYYGLKPVLMVSNNDILKQIFIKDFNLFSDRPEVVPLRVHSFLDYIIPATKIMDCLLLNQKGEEWKRVRTRLSPIFSANKLKMMIPFVQKVTEVTVSILEEKARRRETIDMYDLLQRLTMDVICAQAFAMQTDIQNEGPDNPLFRSAYTIFDNPLTSKILIFGLSFPELSILGMALNFLNMFFANGFSIPPLKITNLIGEVMEQRRNYPDTRKLDLLQNLIEASEPEQTELDESKSKMDSDSDNPQREDTNHNGSKVKAKQGLTDMEIKANALVVFLAGYETTSSSLAYTFHMLSKYPEYQAEIQREIDRCVEGKNLDYYIINNLQFMERFMSETMRFYPPAVTILDRIAATDVDFGYLRIPKGMEITVPIQFMHFSDENWENPEIFDPDRFLSENRTLNRALNYWVFGIGPRNCIGMRLATITSKVVLAKLLEKFTFEQPDNPKDRIMNLNMKYGTMVPDKVLVKVKKREIS